jgi:hypothetical protein
MSDIQITADASQVVALDKALVALKERIREASKVAADTAKTEGRRSQAYKDQKAAIAALNEELVELNQKASLARFEANLRKSVEDARRLETAMKSVASATAGTAAYKGIGSSALFSGQVQDTREMLLAQRDLRRELDDVQRQLRDTADTSEAGRQGLATCAKLPAN